MSAWINYHHLYYFKAIAEKGSVSKAASKLRLGQPTLSAQLRQFEEALGVQLFERQHKKLILTSCWHPDTNEPIMWPARSSTFVTTNIPIITGMLLAPPSPMNTIFWQWINQTYNAGLNYGNRNASS